MLLPCALPRESVPTKFLLARAERLNTKTPNSPTQGFGGPDPKGGGGGGRVCQWTQVQSAAGKRLPRALCGLTFKHHIALPLDTQTPALLNAT